MLKKVKNHVLENRSRYIGGFIGVTMIGVSIYASYRLGAQHGVDIFDNVLHGHDPELWKQVDDLMDKIGVKK